jgi:hypothetical protein
MDRNTVLLWSLIAASVEWASRHRRDADQLAYAKVANDAKEECAQYDPRSTAYLAKNLVDALASPKRRGLIGAIEDIRDEIGEEDPEPDDLLEALTVMVRDIEPRGEAFLKASQVVRVFLTQPVGRKP